MLLLFRNKGKGNFKDIFSSATGSSLNIRLILPEGKEILPIDFLFPGLSLENLEKEGYAFVSEFSGNLSINLEAGGETWALLLFDVPSGSKLAQLEIKDAQPIKIQWK